MQLPFEFQLPIEATFQNYIPGTNAQVVALLQELISTQREKLLYCVGEKGMGLTHLLHATCHLANSLGYSSVYLPLEVLQHHDPNILSGLENLDIICIDNVEVVAQKPAWEEALFHCYNRVLHEKKQLVFASTLLPTQLNLKLPDLKSRLSHCLTLRLDTLNDQNKFKIIRQYSQKIGMPLTKEVERYLFNHCPRDLSTLFKLIDTLDKSTLVEKHRLTVPFVKRIIADIL